MPTGDRIAKFVINVCTLCKCLKKDTPTVENFIQLICFNSSYDSSQICSCSSDKTVILWDVGTGNVARKFRGHAGVRTSYF